MGSCISKCRPRRKRALQDYFDHANHVQDKLVIVSQTPKTTLAPTTSCQSSSSSSSFSSFSCSTQSVSTTGLKSLPSLSLSCSSSVISSKDRSFSNEFLLSCARENPQIICFDEPPLKNRLITDQVAKRLTSPTTVPTGTHELRMDNPRGSSNITQKRARASSPVLTRQKSFRVEPEQRVNSNRVSYGGGRNNYMRSPSPSRRFSGDSSYYNQRANFSTTSSPRVEKSSKRSVTNNYLAKRENVRPPSTTNDYAEDGYFKNQEKRKANGDLLVGVRSEVTAKAHNLEHAPMEDIDNPLIALDCFIFL